MSLFETINGLSKDQLDSVAKVLNIAKNKSSVHKSEQQKTLQRIIKDKLIALCRVRIKKDIHESYEILSLWRDCTLKIIQSKKVKTENQGHKERIIKELQGLQSRDSLTDSNLMVSIVRDILLLLWEESSKKEKEKFIDVVRRELEKHKLKFTEDQLNKSVNFLLVGGVGGAVPIAVPIVAGVMLQQLTRGFIAWFMINVMGQRALQIALLSSLAGPLGWGIAIGTGSLSVALSALKFKSEREKLRFIQAILSIYAFRYQNQFKERRKAS